MDMSKMKVTNLRDELKARGLDTKGPKAALRERLRASFEGGNKGAPTTPGTPSRRSRRNRSLTSPPSPPPVLTFPEPAPEILEEETRSEREEASNHEELVRKEDITQNGEKKNKSADESKEEQVQNSEIADDEHNRGEPMEYEQEHQGEIQPQNTEGSKGEQEDEEEKGKQVSKHDNKKLESENECDQGKESIKKDYKDEEKKKKSESVNRYRSRSHSKECDHSKSHSRSPSRSSSKSRSRSPSGAGSHDTPSKSEEVANLEDGPTIKDKQFLLSWFDSDLHLRIDPDTFTSAKPMTHKIYALVWSGARANYGVREGKVCYMVRLAAETQIWRSHQFHYEPHLRGFRCGFSMPDSTLLLGEAKNSFAYCESGRKAVNSEFTDYAKPYQLDDVIGCYLDLESTPCTIKYTFNGEDLGVAFEFDKSILGEKGALFPHIVTKGYTFHVNFADNEKVNEKEKETLNKSNEENWEMVDETKEDNDEKAEQNKNPKSVQYIHGDTEMKDKEDTDKDKSADLEIDVDNENKMNISSEQTENIAENGDKSPKDKKSQSEVTKDNKTDGDNSEKEKKLEDEDDDGPSPKRKKMDDGKRDNTSSEAEYEEVLPVPRETMSLLPGYKLIALIPKQKYIPGPQSPNSRKECEVILLVGLPGAGKTHWILNHIKENPEKRYTIIGADTLISKMTIDGVSRKHIHKGRWEYLYELCIKSLSSLEGIATRQRRNFILDQTNVNAAAQQRKMKGFGAFRRIAVVCVPSEDELKRRNADKSEKGNAHSIRNSTLENLQANFALPSLECGWFEDIIYTDLSGDEAKAEVKKYHEKAKKALDSNPSAERNRREYQRDDEQNFNRRNDYRRGGHQLDGGGGNRWNRGGGSGSYRPGWRDDRDYNGGGGGDRDYDNRNNRYGYGSRDRYDLYGRGGGRGYRPGRRGDRGYSGGGGGGFGREYNYRNNRYSYGPSSQYNSYGGVAGGGSRDYPNRDRNADGGGGGRRDNYRWGGFNQWDIRPDHLDNRQLQQQQQQNPDYSMSVSGNWQEQPQQYQPAQPELQQQQVVQQYWDYNYMQGYGNQQPQQQQQWQTADPSQQQEWIAWWQQNYGQQQQMPGTFQIQFD